MKLIALFFILIMSLASYNANAAIVASKDDAPIANGKNVLAAVVFNDSAGSSDLTLIIQLKADDKILVDEGHACTAIMPLENIPNDNDPTGWTKPGFDDSKWIKGKYGVGYSDNDDNLVIGDGQHAAIYSRAFFEVSNAQNIKNLQLGVDYDDGTVIWINGVEVARESGTDIPALPRWDSWTDKGSGHSHEASKVAPPNYSFVKLNFKVVGSPFSVEYKNKLTATWASIKIGF